MSTDNNGTTIKENNDAYCFLRDNTGNNKASVKLKTNNCVELIQNLTQLFVCYAILKIIFYNL